MIELCYNMTNRKGYFYMAENKKKVKQFADAASEIKFNMFGSRGVKEIQELAKQVQNEK